MNEVCCNKECVYWTRESDGTCPAADFCGGFKGMTYIPSEKNTEKQDETNNVFFDDEFMSTDDLAGYSSSDIPERIETGDY